MKHVIVNYYFHFRTSFKKLATCASVSERVLLQNLSDENKYDLYEWKHFHNIGFARRLVLTQTQKTIRNCTHVRTAVTCPRLSVVGVERKRGRAGEKMEEGLRRGTGTESPEQASTAACFRSVAKEMKYTLEIVLVLFFGNGVCFEMDKITLNWPCEAWGISIFFRIPS